MKLLFLAILLAPLADNAKAQNASVIQRKLRQKQSFGDSCISDSDCSEIYDPYGPSTAYCIASNIAQTCGYDFSAECDDDYQCGGGFICIDSVCNDNYEADCSSDNDCSGALVCSYGMCADNYGASCNAGHDECSGDLVCYNQICVATEGFACHQDEDCIGDLLCSNQSICLPESSIYPPATAAVAPSSNPPNSGSVALFANNMVLLIAALVFAAIV